MLDGRLRRCAGATAVAADEHHVAVALRYAGSDDAHAHLGHQLHVDPGLRIDVLEVVDELRQVLDRVDVVMRRRRDQLDARRRVAYPADVLVHLETRELAALAGLRALSHLDLEVGSVHQVVGGDAEAAGGHLLDGAGPRVTVGVRGEAVVVLSALARIALCADAIGGYGQGLVCLAADGAQRDCAGGKPLDDLDCRLHLIDWDGLVQHLEVEQAAQCGQLPLPLVDERGEPLVGWVAITAGGVLQEGDGLGVVHVVLAVAPPVVGPALIDLQLAGQVTVGIAICVTPARLFLNGVQTNAAYARGGPGEVLVDRLLVQANGLEDLGAAVALDGRDAHLGHHLEHALVDRLDEVLLGGVGVHGQGCDLFLCELMEQLKGEVRAHRAGAIADEQ